LIWKLRNLTCLTMSLFILTLDLKTKESRCCYHSKVCTQLRMACLFGILVGHYFHAYLVWHAIMEFWRLKQEANEVATNPIQDTMTNLFDKSGNNTVQPCDTNQARSDSDFGIKFSIVQFYAIEHNSKSKRWIELKFTRRFQRYLSILG
jgi:hypothetical protein